jgi:biopolymer transport protein ExbD
VKFRRYHKPRFALEKVRLPLVALLDVILFLLLYFIVAGTIAAPEAELPSSLKTDRQGAGRGSDLQPQILLVDSPSGKVRFRIGERATDSRPALVSVLGQLPKESGIVVKVSGEAPVEAAAAALQACRDAGFSKVSYVASR